MLNKDSSEDRGGRTANILRNWVMDALALSFILLYGAALIGWLKPVGDERMVMRLEPIIFVIIGYYFGRLPSQQNEGTLKNEISRQTQRADAAQHAKEQSHQEREALEEKIKNARAVLASAVPSRTAGGSAEKGGKPDMPLTEDALRSLAVTALNILKS